jgi:hypothetical protein
MVYDLFIFSIGYKELNDGFDSDGRLQKGMDEGETRLAIIRTNIFLREAQFCEKS